ncbi:MAG: MFS transporter [Candidatus Dojkabacteria bacterium]|nr:MFS transporter [Candidatus Dojkabacteria bacterium]
MKRNITIYYITRVFVGLRFIIPVWVAFFLRIITFEQMAIGEVVVFVIATLFELPSGVLADLVGRKLTVASGLIIQGLGYVLVAYAADFQSYLIAFSISSIGGSFVSGAEEALVYDSLKQMKKLTLYSKVKSIEATIYRISLFIGTILGGYLYDIKNILPYVLTGTTMIIAGAAYFFSREPKVDSEKFSLRNYIKNFKLGFMESFKNKRTTYTSLYYTLIFSGGLLLMSYFEQPYCKWLGFDEIEIGWIFGGLIFIKIVAVLMATKIEKFIGQKVNFLLPLLTGLIMLSSVQFKIWGLVVLLVENILLAYRFIFTQKMYNLRINSKYRASAISTLSMFNNIIYLIFVYGLTKILSFDRIGISFNIIGVLFLLAGVIYMRISKLSGSNRMTK